MSVPFRIRFAEWAAGAFIIVFGAIAIIGLLFTQRGRGTFDTPVHYRMVLSDGHGVTAGSPIQMLGIDIGRVSDVRINDDNAVSVELEVQPAYAEKIREDSRATLEASFGLQGVLAGIGVSISPGDPSETLVPDGGLLVAIEPEHVVDLLPGVSSDPLIQDLELLVHNLRLLTDDATDPQGSLRRVLSSMEVVAARVEAGEGTAGKMLGDDAVLYEQVTDTLQDLDATLGRLDGVLRRSDTLVKRSGKTVDEVDEMVQGADALVHDADAVIDDVDQVIGKSDSMVENSDAMIAKFDDVLDDFSGTTQKLDRVTKKLDSLIEEMLIVTDAAGRVFPIRRHVRKSRKRRRSSTPDP